MQDSAASARDGDDQELVERFGEAFWSLPDQARAAFVAHVLLGEQAEIIAALLGRKPRWVMDSIRDTTARLSRCCAPIGRVEFSASELRELLEALPVPEPPAGFYERLLATWDSPLRTAKRR
jgi:hypothetical protein